MVSALLLAAACSGSDGGTGATINDQETTIPDEEIEQLLDNYLTAYETQDEAAVRSATTEHYVINQYAYFDDAAGFRLNYTVNDDIDGVVSEGFGYDWSNEQVGDRIVTGEGPWFVSVEEIWEEGVYTYTGQANYTIIEVDGQLKIANHYWAGLTVRLADE
jgi:hypothetical protein